MKKILLIGDSIRNQYYAHVKKAFEGVAEVYTHDDSARYSVHTYRYLLEWKVTGNIPDDIDVVHWNVGAWDILHMYGEDQPLTPLAEYKRNIGRINVALRRFFPKAKMVFATITAGKDTDEHYDQKWWYYRSMEDRKAYNAGALEVLKNTDTIINDLFEKTKDLSDEYYADATHFSEDKGVAYLSKQVIDVLCEVADIDKTKINDTDGTTVRKQAVDVFGR